MVLTHSNDHRASTPRTRVLVAADQRMYARFLGLGLCRHPDLEIVGVAVGGDPTLDAVTAERPEVVVVDCRTPHDESLTVATRIRQRSPETRVVVITEDHDDPALRSSIADGLAALVNPRGDVADVLAAIRAIREGRGNQYPPAHGVPELRAAIHPLRRATALP